MKRYLFAALTIVIALSGFSGCSEEKNASSSEIESPASVSSEVSELSSELESSSEIESEPSSEMSSEISEAPEREKKPSSGIDSLSDDLYSYQVQIDEDIYQFPMSYENFIAYGWEYNGDSATEIAPNQYTVGERMKKGELEIYVTFVNFDINTSTVAEAYVGGVTIDDSQLNKAGDIKLLLPGNFECFSSNAEDAKAQYGTPSYDNTTDSGMTTIEYSEGSYQTVKMIFDSETKLMYKLDIRNLEAPEDFEAGAVGTETPEIVSKYQTPAAISDNFGDFVVEFGGDLYQIPAPVSTFEANGWTVVADESDETVSGKDFGWVTITKDNQKIRVIANNYSEAATSIKNCFIQRIKGSTYSGEVISVKISKGIEIGMSRSDLEAALEGVTYESEDSSSYTYYEIKPGSSSLDRYEVYVSTDTNLVYKIEVANSPKYSDFTGE